MIDDYNHHESVNIILKTYSVELNLSNVFFFSLVLKSYLPFDTLNVICFFLDYINKVLKGTHVRLGKSENTVRSIGMIVGGDLIQALDNNVPALEFDVRLVLKVS